MAQRLLANKSLLQQLPNDFIVSGDHMSPEAIPMEDAKEDKLDELLIRLRDVKKGEFLVGRHIPREEAIKLSVSQFQQLVEETFTTLLPIYKIIQEK